MKNSFQSNIQFMAGAVLGLTVWLVLCSLVPAQEPATADKVTFDDHVKSIFRQRCAACHSPDKKSGGLDITNFTALMQGGSSGASIEPGDSDGSYLFMLVTHEEEPKMPPGGTKIPEEELNVLKKWIDAGALENMASKAKIKKKKFDMAIAGNAAERPAQIALPPHLPLEPVVHTPKTSCSTALAVSPWSPIAAVASPKQILLYNTQSLELIGVLAFPEGTANVLKFTGDGRLLLAGGGRDAVSGKVVVWDIASGKRQLEVGDELDTVLGADISSDLKWVALGGPSKVVRVYSTRDGSLAYECKKHTDWITSLSFSPDGVLLASGDRGGNAFVWEAPTGNEYLALRGHTDRINSIAWRIDSNLVATASQDTTVRLWEMNNGGQVKSWGAHGGGATAVYFTREGNLVTNGRDRIPKIWNQNGEAQKQFPALPDIGTTVAYCHETQRVIAGDWSGKIMVANVADGVAVGELAMNPLPLANRLATAQSMLLASNAEHQPVAAELAAVTQQMTALQTQLNETNTAKQNLTTEMAASEKIIVDTKTTLETKLAQKAQMQGEMEEKAKLLPSLTELAEKAVAVAAISPQDPELQASAAGLTQKQASIKARVDELTKIIAEITTQTTMTEQEMKAVTEKLAAQKVSLEQMATQITAMESQLTPLQKTVTEKTGVVAQLQQKIEAAQALVNRWQGEIQFITTVRTIESKIAEAQAIIDQKAAAREALEKQLAELKAKVDASSAEEQVAIAAFEALMKELQTVQGIPH